MAQSGDKQVTKQSQFSVIVGFADATFALLLGAPVGIGVVLGFLTYAVTVALFALEAAGKLWKE
jgi:type III secretory pathway component EscT